MSKKKIQELIPTSDDDSGILRQARLDSNSQLPNLLQKVKVRRELLLVCVESEGVALYLQMLEVGVVAEPPELSRLKCAGHHHKGNTDSNALQTEQFLVCRVTFRYNHRILDRISIPPHEGESRDITTIYFTTQIQQLLQQVQSIIICPNSVRHYARHKFKVQS